MESVSAFSSSTVSAVSNYSSNGSTNGSSIFSPETAGTIAVNSSSSLFSTTTETTGIIA